MDRIPAETISVSRLSPDVAERLRVAPREAGCVHSVFDRAVNLAWHDGRLLTLQGPGRLVAPFAAELRWLPHLRAGLRVWCRDHTLVLDGSLLEWDGATTADTAMPPSAGGPARALWARAAQRPVECAPGLSSTRGLAARSRLAEGVSRRDPETFTQGACGLLGLGEGLTPAGDDYLVGTLAVIHRFAQSWLWMHPGIAGAVGQRAATATTVVGREFVVHALGGHFAENMIDLLTGESAEMVGRAAARLLETGATSGADTLAGVRAALAALPARRA